VVAHWLAAALDRRPLRLFGDPRAGRDYVFVDDVTDAMVAVYQRAFGWTDPVTLNIGSGVRTSLIELLATVVVTVREQVVVEFDMARPFDRHDVALDVTAARRALGWQPGTMLSSGIAQTWQAMRAPGPPDRAGVYPSVATTTAG
jgi:UDP-glucose 4-epimerase